MKSRFDDAPSWQRINKFAFKELSETGARESVHSCVPSQLILSNLSITPVYQTEWNEEESAYKSSRCLRCSADISIDLIILFSEAIGVAGTVSSFDNIRIHPDERNAVGRDRNWSLFDATDFTGLGAKAPPDIGLMNNEPGAFRIWRTSNLEREIGNSAREWTSQFDLFLGATQFDEAFDLLMSAGNRRISASMVVVAELFNHEIEATTFAWGSGNTQREFGICVGGDDHFGIAKAQIISLNLGFEQA